MAMDKKENQTGIKQKSSNQSWNVRRVALIVLFAVAVVAITALVLWPRCDASRTSNSPDMLTIM
jgi:flagellar basal body-associated protein FliL